MTTAAGRLIVEERVREILGAAFDGKITPHSFRHYFVTTVLRASGNLKLAQALARHANITVTQRYAHLSDDELRLGVSRNLRIGRRIPFGDHHETCLSKMLVERQNLPNAISLHDRERNTVYQAP